ncbi:hypothetical protein D1BOALGB6SA_88 [Olavius sp. associated proteobacterium Delta 1]|nr:hypothetical protein D1BOALGB6SA_88 [Olavius sp. associated proteobacterium Delta 1]
MYFHYTNIPAVYNIVKTGKVWFSSLAFMNDEMEGMDLHQVLAEVLELKYGSEKCKKTLELIETTIETYLRFQMSFSASTLKDDISQWRAYTHLGQGVCVEFGEGFIQDEGITKVECLYDISAKKTAIIQDRHLKANDVTINGLLESHDDIQKYVSAIIQTLVRFKNASFSPEKEVRWVLSLSGVTDPKARLMYRPHRLGLTTYQEVKVDLTKVKSITLGPQLSKQNLKTFEDFLIEHGCSGYVAKSKVTLR